MRFLTKLLVVALLISAADAAAQPGSPNTGTNRQGQTATGVGTGGAASSLGVNSNTNTLSTGSNTNTNANSNSQFLSGNNTGVNNGSLEVYSGSEPYQGIVLEGSVNLPQLPGFVPTPSNFSQPYKPETFVNTPPFLPAEMTLAEAKECRDSKVSWYGGAREEAQSIKLFYAAKRETPGMPLTMANYVGTAMAKTSDGPFIAALCEAAYRAMRKGATVGVVDYSVRPRNTMSGIGYGASGGATGLPAAGAHPYAIAGTLGFGTGWSSQRVEGEVVLQMTALRESPKSSAAEPGAASPPARSASPKAGGEAPATTIPELTRMEVSPNGRAPAATAVLLTAFPAPEIATIQSARPDPGVAPNGDKPKQPEAAAMSKMESAPAFEGRAEPSHRARHEGFHRREDDAPEQPGTPIGASLTTPSERSHSVTYHSPKKLASIRSGHAKERVFEAFGTVFVRQGAEIVEVEGMRLSVSGRSERSTRIEVGEVSLAESHGSATPYWFLFEDGRLIAWGRPEQWSATATRYRLDLPYRPESRPSRVEAKAAFESAR